MSTSLTESSAGTPAGLSLRPAVKSPRRVTLSGILRRPPFGASQTLVSAAASETGADSAPMTASTRSRVKRDCTGSLAGSPTFHKTEPPWASRVNSPGGAGVSPASVAVRPALVFAGETPGATAGTAVPLELGGAAALALPTIRSGPVQLAAVSAAL